jgi:hypothetical protein
MNYGPAWIVIEESYHRASRRLVSVISPRRAAGDVARYIEQLYVDRFASVHARLAYKKSRKHATYPTERGVYQGIMHCGQDPVFHAIYAHRVELTGKSLVFGYKILVKVEEPTRPVFEERQQSLELDATIDLTEDLS